MKLLNVRLNSENQTRLLSLGLIALTVGGVVLAAGLAKELHAAPTGKPNRIKLLELAKAARLDANPFGDKNAEDHDQDCMDDAAEHKLAVHFRPYFIFDSEETSRRSIEPVTPYRVKTGKKLGACSVPEKISITFAALFAQDGGDARHGDNPSVVMELVLNPSGEVYTLNSVTASKHASWKMGLSKSMSFVDGQHPVIFVSQDYHNFYLDRSRDEKSSPYSDALIKYTEYVDGKGAQVHAVIEHKGAPHGRLNVGEVTQRPGQHFLTDLRPVGFASENAWDDAPFCGGYIKGCSKDPQGEPKAMRILWGN